MEIYQVGGAVRDKLLGQPVHDRDWVVVGSHAAELEALGYQQVGADFPVFLHPESKEEYALARTERKSGRGYHGFVAEAAATVTLEEDLARRDFTINAMAMDSNGEIIDPYNGRADLQAGVLRHVTAAFSEDPLRVLRAARFAARFGFSIAPQTLELMRSMALSGELETLTAERVWQELRGALNANKPQEFLRVLRQCDALEVVFPEIDRLFGIPQPERYHPEIDTGVHILLALEQSARHELDEIVRFAVLVHDLGKGTTPKEIWPSHRGHEERGVALINQFATRLRVPKNHRELAEMVSLLHTRVHRAFEMRDGTLISLLEQADAYRRRDRFCQFLDACRMDARGRTGLEDSPYPQADFLLEARDRSAAADIKDLVNDGLKGAAIATALHQRRAQLISDIERQS